MFLLLSVLADYPLLRAGAPKNFAVLLSFLFSAVFHELIISLPFRHISFHAFFGMLAQAPLIFITKQIDRRSPISRDSFQSCD